MKQPSKMLKALTIIAFNLMAMAGFSQEVQIINSGQLYSTYTFTTTDEAEIKKQVSAYEFDKIKKYCHEDSWPEGIESNSKWSENKYEMNKYKVYKVATFSNKVIIIAPKDENQFMPYNLRPGTHDLYFIMGTSGIQEKTATQANTGNKQEMKIVNSGQLYSTYKIEGSEATSLRNQVSSYEYDRIQKYCHEDAWPSGISTNDNWSKNKYAMNDYKVYKVATIGDKYILLAPSDENQHLPWDLRPTSHDLYFIIGKSGVTEKTTASTGSSKVQGVAVKINETGGLYSTYDLSTDTYADDIRKVVGSEWYDVLKYSKEGEWPSGIASLSARDEVRSKMNDYKAYKIAEFDDKYLLRIPASENSFMPYNMRPSQDIYFIIRKDNVTVTGSSTYNTSSTFTGGTPAKINETGGLYSTYNLSTDTYASDVRSQVGDEWYDVVKYCKEDQWPSAIATLSGRDNVRSKMNDYKAYKIASFDGKYVLRIPAAENKFMPYDMRPTHDIYFIINQENVSITGGSYNNNTGSKVPGKAATINATGGLYSDFNLGTSSYNSTVKTQVGAEYDDVIKYSNDDYWPYGISTFDAREKVRSKMNDYKAYVIASFDNKYVLRIPVSENQFMPYDMRPTHDIYFVINQTDVTVKGGSYNNNSNNPKPIGSE